MFISKCTCIDWSTSTNTSMQAYLQCLQCHTNDQGSKVFHLLFDVVKVDGVDMSGRHFVY